MCILLLYCFMCILLLYCFMCILLLYSFMCILLLYCTYYFLAISLHQLFDGFVHRYRKSGISNSLRSDTSCFYLILDLITFFDLYHGAQMEEALEVGCFFFTSVVFCFGFQENDFEFIKFCFLFLQYLMILSNKQRGAVDSVSGS